MNLLVRNGWYYFNKRIPRYAVEIEKRTHIKIALKTKNKYEALKKSIAIEEELHKNWQVLKNKANDCIDSYARAVAIAHVRGFSYKNHIQIAENSFLGEILNRISTAYNNIDHQQISDCVLGISKAPHIPLKSCMKKYWTLSADRLLNKSEFQIKKYKNPRDYTLNEFIKLVGNKGVSEIARSDILKFHQHLMAKISEGMVPDTGNKKLRYIKDILSTVANANEIPFDEDAMFKNTQFKRLKISRPPFEAEFVQNKILPNLDGLNDDAKYLVYAMADTGAREAELVGLESGDIFLDDPVPHIYIRPKENRALKTAHSERKIPLVGTALIAFKKFPNGFTRYKESDSVSNLINVYFRNHDLKPTPKHSLYSLRHTFKDRLRDIGAPEEIIDQLMGHRTYKPKYGRGHKLENMRVWLERIGFEVEDE
ncbi:MAG: DUF6538 domain-containing protein [Hyphomicrobiales bacterium]